MRKLALILLFSFVILPIAAQQTFISDKATGRPYMVQQYSDVQGTPFLFDDWRIADVTNAAGITFRQVPVKFDAYSNKFLFNHNQNIYEFVTDIVEVEMRNTSADSVSTMIFKKGFAINDKVTPDKYVLVLSSGKLNLVKHIHKGIDETTEYNVPGKVKTFSPRSAFYVSKDAIWQNLKPGGKALEQLLGDKWDMIEPFIKKNFLNSKKEDDLAKIISYYNSL